MTTSPRASEQGQAPQVTENISMNDVDDLRRELAEMAAQRDAAQVQLDLYKCDVCTCGHSRSDHRFYEDHNECVVCGSDEPGCTEWKPDVPRFESKLSELRSIEYIPAHTIKTEIDADGRCHWWAELWKDNKQISITGDYYSPGEHTLNWNTAEQIVYATCTRHGIKDEEFKAELTREIRGTLRAQLAALTAERDEVDIANSAAGAFANILLSDNGAGEMSPGPCADALKMVRDLRAQLAEAKRYSDHLEHENAALAVLHSNAVDERDALRLENESLARGLVAVKDAHNEINALRARLEQAEAERDAALGDKYEWFCESCNTVYPPGKSDGKIYKPCPKCGVACVPSSQNIRKLATLRAERNALTARVGKLQAVCDAAHKLITYRERQSATSFQLEKMDDYIRELDKALAALASGAAVEGEVK